jgi:putative serine protease PepD
VISAKRWVIPAGLVAAVLGAGVVGGVIGAQTSSTSSSPSSSAPATGSCDVATVADKVVPSVVTINAAGPGGTGTGSGELIRADGYILTNNHVISVAAGPGGTVAVLFSDGETATAAITGRDPLTDLAVLKVQATHKVPVIVLGSADVRVGQPVVAVGAPLGLSGTVTSGIVSALNRTISVPGDAATDALLVSAIQTDASINPGNSGGALVDCSGRLVGVPTAGATVPNPAGGPPSGGSIGVGFAIPVDLATSVADQIIATGRVSHAYFGLQTVPIPPSAAAQANLPQGLYVVGVPPGGPAAAAGLRADDVITKIDGVAAVSNTQLQELSLTRKPGDTVAITYVRAGQTSTTSLTLAAQP